MSVMVEAVLVDAQSKGWRVWSHVHSTRAGRVLQMILSSPHCQFCGDEHQINVAAADGINMVGWAQLLAHVQSSMASHAMIGCRH